MTDYLTVLEQAAHSELAPSPATVVTALLQGEKEAKKLKETHSFQELIGTWKLRFFTGTQRAKKQAGIVLGPGRYIPAWVKIYISYSENAQINNCVKLGFLTLNVTGPTKFLPKKNILVFDFLEISIFLFGRLLYRGEMRGGKKSEGEFLAKSLQKQPFFAYFLIQGDKIAARGREGGLALWVKDLRHN